MCAVCWGDVSCRRGLKVVVLEQHDVAGGCTHTFEEHGFEFDTGLHYVGGDIGNTKAPMRVLFDTITDGSLYWDKLDSDIYDTASIRDYLKSVDVDCKPTTVTHVRWHNNPRQTKEELNELFPNEKDAIEAYFAQCKRAETIGGLAHLLKVLPPSLAELIRTACDKVLRDVHQPTADVLRSLTGNVDLQGVVTYVFGDYGTAPAESPFALHVRAVFRQAATRLLIGTEQLGLLLLLCGLSVCLTSSRWSTTTGSRAATTLAAAQAPSPLPSSRRLRQLAVACLCERLLSASCWTSNVRRCAVLSCAVARFSLPSW